MKTSIMTSIRALLRLPGVAPAASPFHDPLLPPGKPLRRMFSRLATPLAVLGLAHTVPCALAATDTATYDLGPQDAGTTILPGTGGLLPWIAKGTLPPGSILRSVSIDARL
ncbi:MAG: hypothetical protein K9N23_12080, partial [Akkermansiaceae bacterium]|nr:hypothetical protein [Akkermansiaceae bacterium]